MWRSIAELRWERREDPRGAIEALDRCVTLLPRDVEARAALAEMLMELGDVDAALMCLEIASAYAPGRVRDVSSNARDSGEGGTYRSRLSGSRSAGRARRGRDGGAALLRPVPSGDSRAGRPGRWTRTRGRSCIRSITTCTCAISFRSWRRPRSSTGPRKLQQLKALPVLDPKNRQDPATSTVTLTRTFVWASKVLNSPLPEIYVADDVPGGIAAVPAPSPTAMVGKSVLSGKSMREMSFPGGQGSDLLPSGALRPGAVRNAQGRDPPCWLGALRVIRPNLAVPDEAKLEVRELSNGASIQARRRGAGAPEGGGRGVRSGGRTGLISWAGRERSSWRRREPVCCCVGTCRSRRGSSKPTIAALPT